MTTRDISFNLLNTGAWQLSAMVNGYLVGRTYFGYTKREAIALFKEYVATKSRKV